MVQIPLTKSYKPKKRLDKKHHKKQLEKLCSGVEKKTPAQQFFEDIVWGDVKAPTKFDKFIVQKTTDTEMFVRSHIARLAKVSAYIGRQIRRWVEETIVDDIAEWYKRWDQHPFTTRLLSIEQPCKEVEGILARRLSNLRGDFKAGYEKMLTVANQCDRERIGYRGTLPVKPIKDFRSAAAEFYETVDIIHVEAKVELNKLTKTGQKARKRGKGVLNEHVGELLKSSKSDITKNKVAETLNKNYAGVHRDTTGESVAKTKNWQNRRKLKNGYKKK